MPSPDPPGMLAVDEYSLPPANVLNGDGWLDARVSDSLSATQVSAQVRGGGYAQSFLSLSLSYFEWK